MRRNGFTLVELLVVIGIIALLISVLLPALNKARQQANLLDCQARLRTMGQAIQIYTIESRGLLPWGAIQHGAPWTSETPFTSTSAHRYEYWRWFYTLSQTLNRNAVNSDGYLTNSRIFTDVDTVEGSAGTLVNHYTANIRLFCQANVVDNGPTIFGGDAILQKDRTQRKLASIKRPSSTFAIWDGPQVGNFSNNAYEISGVIDSYGVDQVTGLFFNSPNAAAKYGRAVLPGLGGGQSGVTDGKALQKSRNIDYPILDQWVTHLRFRHLKNTALAALCIDGHVETRVVGTVMVQDIFTNYK